MEASLARTAAMFAQLAVEDSLLIVKPVPMDTSWHGITLHQLLVAIAALMVKCYSQQIHAPIALDKITSISHVLLIVQQGLMLCRKLWATLKTYLFAQCALLAVHNAIHQLPVLHVQLHYTFKLIMTTLRTLHQLFVKLLAIQDTTTTAQCVLLVQQDALHATQQYVWDQQLDISLIQLLLHRQ